MSDIATIRRALRFVHVEPDHDNALEVLARVEADLNATQRPVSVSATPDPTRALARLFAAWWKNEQATFKMFQTASLRCEDFLYAKLIEPDGMVRARLTALGEAALRLAEDGRWPSGAKSIPPESEKSV